MFNGLSREVVVMFKSPEVTQEASPKWQRLVVFVTRLLPRHFYYQGFMMGMGKNKSPASTRNGLPSPDF
jgi:hypothetical protein